MTALHDQAGTALAEQVRAGALTARTVVENALARIATLDGRVGAFTEVVADRALARAAALDAAGASRAGPLAGMPFAVKNLFDLEGLSTRAGAKINRDRPPAARDATLVERLEAAGAICVGALNMGEYAYDFTGENVHDGPSRNPHDLARMSGGSSGGSGSAVAAGFVPLALGSDTNGSIRVPSSLCGLFGLKPTYGRLSRARTFPFVASLDHLGPLARSVQDLAVSYDAMQGPDHDDAACTERAPEHATPALEQGIAGLRIARLGGYFTERCGPEAQAALGQVAEALDAHDTAHMPQALEARAAAYLITTTEGAALHLDRLRHRAEDFDPATRDRLIAGAMIPAAWVAAAQKVRRAVLAQTRALFATHDVLLAPATPCVAPPIGQTTMVLGGETLNIRAHLGLLTQPVSCIGLPVVAVPVWLAGAALPIGVQVIAAPWREDVALRVARHLERVGSCRAPIANL